MTRSILPLAGLLLLCAASTLRAQSPTESAHDLVKDVVYNELQERRHVSLWQYRVDKRAGNQNTIEQEVDKRVKAKSGQNVPGTTPGPSVNSNIRSIMSRGRTGDPNAPQTGAGRAAAALDKIMSRRGEEVA